MIDNNVQHEGADDQLTFIRQVAGMVPDFIAVMELSTRRLVYCNNESFMLNGYERGEIQSMSVEERKELVHPEDRTQLDEFYTSFTGQTNEEETRTVHYRAKNKAGEYLNFFSRGKIFQRNPDGSPHTILNIVQNVTQQKREEEEITKQAHFIYSITDMIPAVIAVTSHPSGDIEYNNRDMMKLLGFEPDEIVQAGRQERLKLMHPNDREAFANYISRFDTLKDDEENRVEYRAKNKQGNWVWMDARGRVFERDEQGRPKRILQIAQDVTAGKKAEKDLLDLKDQVAKKATDKYLTLFNSIDEAIAMVEVEQDNAGEIEAIRFLEVNPAYEKITGFANVAGKTVAEVLPDMEQYWNHAIARVWETGESVRIEHYSEYAGRWFSAHCSRVGTSNALAFVFSDVTERKRHEYQQLLLVEVSRDLVEFTTISETMKRLGEKVAAHMGISWCMFAEHIGETDPVIETHGWNAPGLPSLEGRFRMRDYLTDEHLALHNAGTITVVTDAQTDPRIDGAAYVALGVRSFVSIPLSSNGQWDFMISLLHNEPREWRQDEIDLIKEITGRIWSRVERAKADEALKISEARLASLVNAVPTAIGLIDTDGKIILSNKETATFLVGDFIPSRGPKRKQRWAAWYPDNTPVEPENFPGARALRGQSVIPGMEMLHTKEDGTQVWTLVSSVPVKNKSGEVTGAAYSIVDITQHKNAEQAIREFNVRLENEVAERTMQLKETIEQLESFNYIASHDLQEPLRKIRTYAELLKENQLDNPKLQGYLTSINDSSGRMSKLIDSLLSYSRNTRDDVFQVVDLNQVLEDVRSDYEILIREKGARIESTKLPVLQAVPFQLHQLFANLVSNSLKFSQNVPVIRISSRTVSGSVIPYELPAGLRDQQYTEITFSDNGIGFDNRYRDKIFQLFQRLDTRKEYSGTGIGLSIVRRIIQQHDGYITADGKLNEGAVFTVYLPVGP